MVGSRIKDCMWGRQLNRPDDTDPADDVDTFHGQLQLAVTAVLDKLTLIRSRAKRCGITIICCNCFVCSITRPTQFIVVIISWSLHTVLLLPRRQTDRQTDTPITILRTSRPSPEDWRFVFWGICNAWSTVTGTCDRHDFSLLKWISIHGLLECDLTMVALAVKRQIVHCVPESDTALACYNFDVHQPILIIFGRNVSETAGSEIIMYLSTSPKQCLCTTRQNTETQKSHPFTHLFI